MKKLVFLLCFFIYKNTNAQIGFSNTYEMNVAGAAFHNIIIYNDTLIVVGSTKVDSLNNWGLLFAKFDTLGNLIDSKTYFDSGGDSYVFSDNSEIIGTSDGGYLMLGNFFAVNKSFILKLDNNGNLEFLKEYEEPYNLSFYRADEISDGYLIGGIKVTAINTVQAFLMKTDFYGNVIWEKKFGEYSSNSVLNSLQIVDDNTMLLGLSHSDATFISTYSYDYRWKKGSIIGLDSLGEIKFEWESDLNIESGMVGLHRMDDGGYLYSTAAFVIHNQWTWGRDIKIIRRDSNFNLVWELNNVTPKAVLPNFVFDIEKTPDDNYMLVGQWAKAFNPYDTSYVYVGGSLYHFSGEGDSIWLRCDTVIDPIGTNYPYEGFTLGKYRGMAVSSSGSVYAAGKTDYYDLVLPPRSLGWIVKVDKYGCLDTLCNFATALPEVSFSSPIKIYPNPVRDNLHVQVEGKYNIRLFDMLGRQVKRGFNHRGNLELDVKGLESGIYFLEIKSKGKRWVEKIVVE